jgi:Transposase IS116/IS110/IS902 family
MRHRQGLSTVRRTGRHDNGANLAAHRMGLGQHQPCVTILDAAGAIVDCWTVAHTEHDLDALLARLATYDDPAESPVAIEPSEGLVVDRLIAAGHPVVPVDPGATTTSQPGRGQQPARRAAGRPLARRQAAVLPARLQDRVSLSGRVPDPAGGRSARRTPAGRVLPPACLPRRPPSRRAAQTAPISARAAGGLDPTALAQLVGAQTRLLATLMATIAELDETIGKRLGNHPKAHLLARLPRVGQVSHAQLLAELGPILNRASSADHAAAEAGATPVTRASGKTSSVHFRLAANRRARQALHVFADNARHGSPWAATLYADARARGKRHPQAVRRPGPGLAAGHLGLLAHQHPLRPRQAPRRTTPRRRLT